MEGLPIQRRTFVLKNERKINAPWKKDSFGFQIMITGIRTLLSDVCLSLQIWRILTYVRDNKYNCMSLMEIVTYGIYMYMHSAVHNTITHI